MSSALDSALAFCLASYNVAPATTSTPSTVKVVKAKPKAVNVSGAQAAPIHPASKQAAPVVMDLPSAGTMDAKAFMSARRWAKDRDETIQAIAAYIGYDLTQPFGLQDSAAVDAANREINPPKAREFKRSSIPSVAGYVKGAPDHGVRHVQNLQARERLAVDTMLAHEASARSADGEYSRTLYEGLALIEKNRLAEIRADLKRSL
jgi:hypothetical protein